MSSRNLTIWFLGTFGILITIWLVWPNSPNSILGATLLPVPQGGTGTSTFPINSLIASHFSTSTGPLQATTSPTVNAIIATSTIASSTIQRLSVVLASSTILYLDRFWEGTEIDTPATPATNKGRWYVKDDGSGLSAPFFLGDDGIEIQLGAGGGGGGCTTLSCLTDAEVTSPFVRQVLRYDGTNFVNQLLDMADITGFATSTQGGTGYATSTLGDLLYGGSSNNWLKLGIGSANQGLIVSGGIPVWGDVVLINGAQTINNVKTFTQYPLGPGTTPTTSTQLVDKAYVDGIPLSLRYKENVLAATTTNLTLSGVQTIDGYAAVSGDRTLAAGQTTTANNGCYTQASGAWIRCTDYDSASEIVQGTSFPVTNGQQNAGSIFIMSTTSVVTLGTDPITFTKYSPPVYTGTNNITVTGTQIGQTLGSSGGLSFFGLPSLWVDHDNSTLATSSGKLAIKALGITNGLIANGTIDLTTKVTGVLPFANGGTGLSAAADDTTLVSGGGSYTATGLPSCTDTGGQHLNYNQSTNAFSCGTSGGGGGSGGGGIINYARWLDTSSTTVVVQNSSTQTTLYSYTVPANTLGTDGHLRLVISGRYRNNSGANRTMTLRLTYGGTTMIQKTSGNIGTGAATTTWFAVFNLNSNNFTNAQDANMTASFENSAGTSVLFDDRGSAAVDSTSAQTLTVTAQHSATNANLSIAKHLAVLHLMNATTSVGASNSSAFVTIGNDGSLSAERALTGTTNQITVTDNGANSSAVLSIPNSFTLPSASPTFTGLTLSGLTSGSVVFAGASGVLSQNNTRFFWDNSNFRLGIGTSSPYAMLGVSGEGVFGFLTATTTATSTFAGHLNFGLNSFLSTSTLSGNFSIQKGNLELSQGKIFQTGTNATSSFSGGINLYADGCLAVLSNCITIGGSAATNEIAFGLNANEITSDPTFIFNKTTKNLGIGTTSPTFNLSVQGRAIISSTTSISALVATGTVNVGDRIIVTGTGTSTLVGGLNVATTNGCIAKNGTCVTPTTRIYTVIADADGAGFLCTNCPVAGTEFFPAVTTDLTGLFKIRLGVFCDAACNANTTVELLDSSNNIIATVSGPGAADSTAIGSYSNESIATVDDLNVRIKGSGAAADDYRITHVYFEVASQ